MHSVRTGTDSAYLRNVTAMATVAGLTDAAPAVLHGIYGPITLPTLGTYRSSEMAHLDTTHRPSTPVRTVQLDVGSACLTVAIDDVDPYRDCHGTAASGRLFDDEWRAWERGLQRAWELLVSHTPARAAEIATGLRAVTALAVGRVGEGISITHGDAFGGFAATRPTEPAELAAMIVHEFQHSKINAVQELLPLYADDLDPGYFAPWRPDPRPLSGLLQGVAAFTAVAERWQAFRSEPRLEESATARFALLRAQLRRAAPQLESAPGLTAAGQRLVAGLAATVTRLSNHAVPRRDEQAAQHVVVRDERRWRTRWGRPHPVDR